jgi:hypothetical protein
MATQYTDPTARSDPFGSWAASPDFPDAQTYNFAMPKRSPNFELNLDAGAKTAELDWKGNVKST